MKLKKAKSSIWKHFTAHTRQEVECNLCSKIIRVAGGTSNMWKHLEKWHNSAFTELSAIDSHADGRVVEINSYELQPGQPLLTTETGIVATTFLPHSDDLIEARDDEKNLVKKRKTRKHKSAVWEHFHQGSNCGPDEAKCNYCGMTVKKGGGTSNMAKHVKRRHPELLFDGGGDNTKLHIKAKRESLPQDHKDSDEVDSDGELHQEDTALTGSDVSWPPEVILSLCDLVHRFPILWDPKDEHFQRGKMRRGVLEEVTQQLKALHPSMTCLTPPIVRIKFSSLKHYFFKEHEKQQQQQQQQNETNTEARQWDYYSNLLYLANTLPPSDKPSCGSGPSDEEEHVSGSYLVEDGGEYAEPTNVILKPDKSHSTTTNNNTQASTATATKPVSTPGQAGQAQTCTPIGKTTFSHFSESLNNNRKNNNSNHKRKYNSEAPHDSTHNPELPSEVCRQYMRSSYAASIGSIVESLIKMCPEDRQQEFGLFLLEIAHKKYLRIT